MTSGSNLGYGRITAGASVRVWGGGLPSVSSSQGSAGLGGGAGYCFDAASMLWAWHLRFMLPLALTGQQKCQCQISYKVKLRTYSTSFRTQSVPRRPEPTVQKRGGQMQLYPENPRPDRLLRVLLTWDASRAARVGVHTYLPGHTSPLRCPWESWAQQKPRLTGDLEGCVAPSHGSSADSGHERNEQQFLMNSLQFHGLEPRTHYQCFKSKCASTLSQPLAVYGKNCPGGEHQEGSALQVLAWCVHTHHHRQAQGGGRRAHRASSFTERNPTSHCRPPALHPRNQEQSLQAPLGWAWPHPNAAPPPSSGRGHSRSQEAI